MYENCPRCDNPVQGEGENGTFKLTESHSCDGHDDEIVSWKPGPGNPPGSFELTLEGGEVREVWV